MAFENGVNWQPIDPEKRGRHATFDKAVAAALSDMLVQRDEFFDSLAERWPQLFPDLPIRPGRYENGLIFLYVRSAPLLFMMRPKLRMIANKLAEQPGAPKKIDLKVEIRP